MGIGGGGQFGLGEGDADDFAEGEKGVGEIGFVDGVVEAADVDCSFEAGLNRQSHRGFILVVRF